MRVIIIQDKDCKALLDKLKLCKYVEHRKGFIKEGATIEEIYDHVHSAFVYEVVGWLNEQGAH